MIGELACSSPTPRETIPIRRRSHWTGSTHQGQRSSMTAQTGRKHDSTIEALSMAGCNVDSGKGFVSYWRKIGRRSVAASMYSGCAKVSVEWFMEQWDITCPRQ